jgi:hypothetical protein
MSRHAFLLSFSAIVPSGIYGPPGHTPWKPDQRGPEDVERSQALDMPYPGFGKLSVADKMAFAVASLLLRSYAPPNKNNCGICLGIATGSLSIDLRYWESVIAGFPSPGLFSATLPSSPISEIAIFHGLKGPNRIVANGEASGTNALLEALLMLQRKKAETMLVVSLHALEPADRRVPIAPPFLIQDNRAFAFLLSSTKPDAVQGTRISALSVQNARISDARQRAPFDTLVEMLMAKQFGCVDFAQEDTCGSLLIEKDE